MDNMISAEFKASTGNQYRSQTVNAEEKTGVSFADSMAEKFQACPRDMTLGEYKAYFNDMVNKLYTHPSQKNVFWDVDITDAAYERMRVDPTYERQVLNYLARNKAANWGGHAPRFVLIHIDDTWEKCYGYTMGRQDNDRYARYVERKRREAKLRAKKERRKKLLKEYLKKKAEAKRVQDMLINRELEKRWLEHDRMIRKWNRKRQIGQAARAYEASLIMKSRSV